MTRSARGAPAAKALFGLLAVNFAGAMALSELVGLAPGHWGRLAAFLIAVVVLFTLNQALGRAMPRYRWWFRTISALNLAAAFLVGVIAFLPNFHLVARALAALIAMASEAASG